MITTYTVTGYAERIFCAETRTANTGMWIVGWTGR